MVTDMVSNQRHSSYRHYNYDTTNSSQCHKSALRWSEHSAWGDWRLREDSIALANPGLFFFLATQDEKKSGEATAADTRGNTSNRSLMIYLML